MNTTIAIGEKGMNARKTEREAARITNTFAFDLSSTKIAIITTIAVEAANPSIQHKKNITVVNSGNNELVKKRRPPKNHPKAPNTKANKTKITYFHKGVSGNCDWCGCV